MECAQSLSGLSASLNVKLRGRLIASDLRRFSAHDSTGDLASLEPGADLSGEPLYVYGSGLGEEDWQIDFSEALQYLENNLTRLYTTADPYYISEFIAVNPATAEEVCKGANSDAKLYRARGLGEEAEA